MFRRTFGSYFLKDWAEKLQKALHETDAAKIDKEVELRRIRSVDELVQSVTGKGNAKVEASQYLCPRSAIFVPGSNKKALKKAELLFADVIILDLEDSVPLSGKSQAREAVVDAVMSGAFKDRRVVIRINSPRLTPDYGFPDLDAVTLVAPFVEAVAIPKTSVEDYGIVEKLLPPEMKLWAFFETPRSILEAKEICASRKYQVAVMGTNDLSADMYLPSSVPPIARTTTDAITLNTEITLGPHPDSYEASVIHKHLPRYPLHYALSSVVMACRAYGVHPIDGVYNNPSDVNGFRMEAAEGKRLGFSGKTLIHPAQIDPCHQIFSPSDVEVAWAKRILQAEAGKRVSNIEKGLPPSTGGVMVVEGRMVEQMHIDNAKRVLQTVERIALEKKKEDDAKIPVDRTAIPDPPEPRHNFFGQLIDEKGNRINPPLPNELPNTKAIRKKPSNDPLPKMIDIDYENDFNPDRTTPQNPFFKDR
jgi:citrate lyase subunit beta/citryl-CoA lyase